MAGRGRKTLVLAGSLTLAAAIAALAAWPRITAPAPRGTSPAAVQVQAPGGYGSEAEWIVWQTLRFMASGAAAARSGAGAATPNVYVRARPASEFELLEHATFDVIIDGHPSITLEVQQHIWTPETYVVAARLLLGASSPRPARPAPTRPGLPAPGGDGTATTGAGAQSGALLEALTNPRLDVILDQEARVSSALAAAPYDAAPYEQAALLTALLALRDSAGTFSDTRPMLSRTTAHLALARALAPDLPAGPCAQVAEIIVSALAGREDLAIAALDGWRTASSPAAATWRAALRLRVTGDWRQVRPGRSTPLLLRLEYARALAERLDAPRLLEFVDGAGESVRAVDDPVDLVQELAGIAADFIGGDDELQDAAGREAAADWHRIVLHAAEGWKGFGIEAGHRFADAGLAGEFAEALTVWRRYHEGEASREVLIDSLNDEGPGPWRAIDWPAWAQFLQRHLCAQLRASRSHLNNLGLHQELEAWPGEMKARFGQLRLFPFVFRHAVMTAAQYKEASALARDLQIAHPDAVTARLSVLLRSKPWVDAPPETFPSDTPWFTPHVPTGTVYELSYRTLTAGCPRPVPLEIAERWARRAPHDMWVQWSIVFLRADVSPTFADVRRSIGGLPEYDLRAGDHMFRYLEGTHEEYEWIARIMCGLTPDECAKLGGQLMVNGQDEEAAAIYDRFAREARSSVTVSNEIGWLVNYYWDTGRHERAVDLAETAGDTGSATGMEILGRVRERQGRLSEAEALHAGVAERYHDSNWSLARHYLRQARRLRDDAWVKRAGELLPTAFPHGIETARKEGFSGPPVDGVRLHRLRPRAQGTGIREDDILVALNGHRVRTVEQYHVLAGDGFGPDMSLVVWRGGCYQEIEAHVPQRWFGATLSNHTVESR